MPRRTQQKEKNMEIEFLDDAAPELASWITHRGSYLFEEQPAARRRAALDLQAVETDEADDWPDSEDAWK